jgi:hypothetical protein
MGFEWVLTLSIKEKNSVCAKLRCTVLFQGLSVLEKRETIVLKEGRTESDE